MEYRCELTQRSAEFTLCIRTRAPQQDLPHVVPNSYGVIMEYAGRLGVEPSGPPYVAYFNMDPQAFDMEIGFPFGKALPGKGEILSGLLPAGRAAACLHVGPYPQLGAAYEALSKWVEAQGYTVTGVAYEFYLNDPQTTPASELQTQIVFPLK